MLLLASVLVFAEVFFRYILGNPLGWTEELVRYFLVWITFLGTYLGVREDKHLQIKVFFNKCPVEIQYSLEMLGDLCILVFFILFSYLGIVYVITFFSDLSPSLEIPMGIIYLAIPISGIFIVYQITLKRLKYRKHHQQS